MSCHHRHSQVCQVACATACNSKPQSSCEWCGHDRCHATTGTQCAPLVCAAACNSMPQPSCDWRGHDRCHATTGTHKCARLHVQPHATACHSQTVIGVAMTDVMTPQALKCARLHVQPQATACHSQAVIGVAMTNVMPPQALTSVPGCMCNRMQSMPQPSCDWRGHDRCHATTGTLKCARLHVQPHATTCHSQAVIGVAMTDVMPPQALTSVPDCKFNRMQQHATAKL